MKHPRFIQMKDGSYRSVEYFGMSDRPSERVYRAMVRISRNRYLWEEEFDRIATQLIRCANGNSQIGKIFKAVADGGQTYGMLKGESPIRRLGSASQLMAFKREMKWAVKQGGIYPELIVMKYQYIERGYKWNVKLK